MGEANAILVSVLVMSYNAEAYIIDLLESILHQQYAELELIIADDNSRDRTIEKIKHWLLMNGGRFERTRLLTSDRNNGTVRNINNGLNYCKGKFIKIIAADDILVPNCISDSVQVCLDHNWEMAIGKAEWVQDDGKSPALHNENKRAEDAFYKMSARQQYAELLKHNDLICSPAAFYKMSFLKKYQGFDEAYTLIEDYPFWLKITANGDHINHFDHVVVKYRQSITSATNPEKAVQIYNARITKDSKKIFYRQRMWGLLKNGQIKIVVRNIRRYFIRDLVIMLGNSSKNKLCYALTRFE